jgi:hypothetical protein
MKWKMSPCMKVVFSSFSIGSKFSEGFFFSFYLR